MGLNRLLEVTESPFDLLLSDKSFSAEEEPLISSYSNSFVQDITAHNHIVPRGNVVVCVRTSISLEVKTTYIDLIALL